MMATVRPDIAQDQELLGMLAMRYRRTQDPVLRHSTAQEYADAVERLIRSGAWEEAPPPEDQLPDEDMPSTFFEFWMR